MNDFKLPSNAVLGLSDEVIEWLGTTASSSPSTVVSPWVRSWKNVLNSNQILQLLRTSNHNYKMYFGESYWCPSSDYNADWKSFFLPIKEMLHIENNVEGVEWWLRRSPVQNAKPFHFDKDEGCYSRYGRLLFPALTSVIYLTSGGPTLIVNNGQLCKAHAHPGTMICFDGKLCHAVVAMKGTWDRQSLVMNWWPKKPLNLKKCELAFCFPKIGSSKHSSATVSYFSGASV